MPRFAANLTTMFSEWSFLDRFGAAADAGFLAVECQFPYDYSCDAVCTRLLRNSLSLVMFNLPAGDFAAGDRGMAALTDRFGDVQASVRIGLEYARATGTRRLHLLAGMADKNDRGAADAYYRALLWAAEEVATEGIELLIEPLNTRDMPGYFLDDFNYAERVISELAIPNLKLQFDIYHRQILHGDVTVGLRRALPIIGHVQVASIPTRGEPGTGEINDFQIFEELDRLGYDGFVGCEYHPRAGTCEGLSWMTVDPVRAAESLGMSGQMELDEADSNLEDRPTAK